MILARTYRQLLVMALLLGVLGVAEAKVEDFSTVENIAILSRDRERPFYTFATESLQTLSGSDKLKGDEGKLPAMEVIFKIWSQPKEWAKRPIILINYKPLKSEVGFDEKQKLFSLEEITANEKLNALMKEAVAKSEDPDKPKLDRRETEARDVYNRASLLVQLMNGAAFSIVPVSEGGASDEITAWRPLLEVEKYYPSEQGKKTLQAFSELKDAFVAQDNQAFNTAGASFSEALRNLHPQGYPEAELLSLETFYGKLHPFKLAWVLYAAGAILLGLTSLRGRQVGYKLAWIIIALGFAFQIYGFVVRTIISGRAPVTNMYESVIWVAFGVMLFAMILEALYRSRIIFIAAIPVAVVALILADTQTTVLNASIDPLQPVLRDNFWLSTHVTSIALAYSAFALALGVAHLILFRFFLNKGVPASFYNYLYRSLQIGVLLLAIGTILGGVWANYSWGRFWDWDPKETWALITLLAYIFLLHGRIMGAWGGFGLAIGSILGFIAVVMAWYGVNFVLGEGLHSYGFGVGGLEYAIAYVVIELLIVIAALLVKLKRKAKAVTGSTKEEEDEE